MGTYWLKVPYSLLGTIYELRPIELPHTLVMFLSLNGCLFITVWLHSQKELAHWTVHVTVQIYACCFSGWLRCNFRTGFFLSGRLDIYTWPVKNNEHAWKTKITGVEMMTTSDGVCLLLRCSDALQWVYLRGHLTSMTLCTIIRWWYTQICLRWW